MPSSSDPTTVLVTGGAGFVGSHIALHLARTTPGARVIALDNLKRRGSELNIARLTDGGVHFVHGDVREQGDLFAMPRIDVLVDCAAEPSVMAGQGGGADYVVRTNLLGTVHCLELAARDGADVLFLSTSRVYPYEPLNAAAVLEGGRYVFPEHSSMPGLSHRGVAEELPLDGLRTLYGSTKLASELLLAEYAQMHGFRYVVDRCGVIAGPWQMGKTDQGFLLLWLASHRWGRPLSYIGHGGHGQQVRDVLHVQDLCELVALQLGMLDSLTGRTFNAGGGLANSASLQEVTTLCEEVTGRSIPMGAVAEDRPGDLKSYITDNTRITAATGWAPRRDLATIAGDAHDWLLQHEEQLEGILA